MSKLQPNDFIVLIGGALLSILALLVVIGILKVYFNIIKKFILTHKSAKLKENEGAAGTTVIAPSVIHTIESTPAEQELLEIDPALANEIINSSNEIANNITNTATSIDLLLEQNNTILNAIGNNAPIAPSSPFVDLTSNSNGGLPQFNSNSNGGIDEDLRRLLNRETPAFNNFCNSSIKKDLEELQEASAKLRIKTDKLIEEAASNFHYKAFRKMVEGLKELYMMKGSIVIGGLGAVGGAYIFFKNGGWARIIQAKNGMVKVIVGLGNVTLRIIRFFFKETPKPTIPGPDKWNIFDPNK